MSLVRRTRSLCPVCLRVIDARYVRMGTGDIALEKTCPDHGLFSVPAWAERTDQQGQQGLPDFSTWCEAARTPPVRPVVPFTAATGRRGCPFDCGLCPEHGQRTCCALLEVTSRCNLRCPVCYASSEPVPAEHASCANTAARPADPDLPTLRDRLRALREQAGQANVQLSGGEPTLRDDLPAIIELVRAEGFPFVQLNTNGLRLGREAGYANTLRDAGLDVVYLQWDGLRETTLHALRGAPCLTDKRQALDACLEAGLSVVLVATVVAGVNADELGDLLRFALDCGPLVRGLHLQPAASFGRFFWNGDTAPRLTLPDLMHALEVQSHGLVRATDLHPPSSEHPLCSFSALYRRTANGLALMASEPGCCCAPAGQPEAARQARDFVARHWGPLDSPELQPGPADGFDAFLASSGLRQRFTLSAMAFQDVYSLDLERVRRCHVHVVSPEGRLVPFCLYNLTAANGQPLHREV